VAIRPSEILAAAYLGTYIVLRSAMTWMIGIHGLRQRYLWKDLPLIPLWDAGRVRYLDRKFHTQQHTLARRPIITSGEAAWCPSSRKPRRFLPGPPAMLLPLSVGSRYGRISPGCAIADWVTLLADPAQKLFGFLTRRIVVSKSPEDSSAAACAPCRRCDDFRCLFWLPQNNARLARRKFFSLFKKPVASAMPVSRQPPRQID